jgi:hypothetical protein
MRGDDLDLGLGAIQKFPLSTGFFLGCLASGFCFFWRCLLFGCLVFAYSYEGA